MPRYPRTCAAGDHWPSDIVGGAIIGIAVGFIVHRLLQKFWKPKPAESLPKIAQESNLFAKKVVCRTLFGSNLVLANRDAGPSAPRGGGCSGRNQRAGPS